MRKFNQLPEESKVLTSYNEQRDFFAFNFEKIEFRQPLYASNNRRVDQFSLRIYWIKEEKGLGYGIADDWKNKRVVFYRFGDDEAWTAFRASFAAQFQGDYS